MPKATLAFNLSDPDDAQEHRYALAGKDALIALERLCEQIRSALKYGSPSPETRKALEEIRATIPPELLELLV